MIDEHFGMAASEPVVRGCVVLVPDSGSQTEIAADAVEKIVHVQLGAIVARHASGAA